ncbi:hypothetical protein ACC772_38595, partial [Rhizobium ruizarguesonis]
AEKVNDLELVVCDLSASPLLDAWVGCAKALEQVVEGKAFDAAELLFEVVGLQEIPSPAAGAHDTQWNLLS